MSDTADFFPPFTGTVYMVDHDPVPKSHPVKYLRGKVLIGFAVDPADMPSMQMGTQAAIRFPKPSDELPFGDPS